MTKNIFSFSKSITLNKLYYHDNNSCVMFAESGELMKAQFWCLFSTILMICVGCIENAELTNERELFIKEIENQQIALTTIFSDEILIRNEFRLIQNPDLMHEQKYLDKIGELYSRRINAENAFAKNLRKFYEQFKDKSAYSQVLNLYILPKIKVIHDLKRFESEIKRKQIISEMLEEYKKGNIQDKQVLRFLDDYKKGKTTKYKENSFIESESSILFNTVFTEQYTRIEGFIGDYLTLLQGNFSDFEEVREVDDEIVRPYYKKLISSLPSNNKRLTLEEKKVLHGHLKKIIKLFPHSNLTVKAERKLIPLTAKMQLSELTGTPLVFFLLILTAITFGYTVCLRGFLKHKQSEQEVSEIFKSIGSQQISEPDAELDLQSRMFKED